jgi:hypothetical protein
MMCADKAWEEVVLTSVHVMPVTNPLSNAFLTLLHDSLPLPKPAFVAATAQKLLPILHDPATTVAVKRNVLIAWGILAEKMAGVHCELLLTEQLTQALVHVLQSDQNSLLTFSAVYAVEKFGMSGLRFCVVIRQR